MRKWLRDYRGNRTQQAVADKIGIERSTLAKAELGGSIRIDTAKRIANFYGCSWVLFFDPEGDKSAHKDAM